MTPVPLPPEERSGDSKPVGSASRGVLVIVSALMVWAVVLAIGVFLNSDSYLKASLVLGSMAFFLSVWGVAIWLKKNRSNVRDRISE